MHIVLYGQELVSGDHTSLSSALICVQEEVISLEGLVVTQNSCYLGKMCLNPTFVLLLLASERSERDTLWSVQLRIADIYIVRAIRAIFVFITRKEGGA